MNFDFVTDRLAIGTTPMDLADVNVLKQAGITDIINCRDDHDDAPLLTGSGIRYLWLPTKDWNPLHPEHKPVQWFEYGVEYALPALSEPKRKIYVHCIAGANRSASLTWTILRALGLTAGECFMVIDTHRLIDVVGLIECGWYKDGENACRELGYI